MQVTSDLYVHVLCISAFVRHFSMLSPTNDNTENTYNWSLASETILHVNVSPQEIFLFAPAITSMTFRLDINCLGACGTSLENYSKRHHGMEICE